MHFDPASAILSVFTVLALVAGGLVIVFAAVRREQRNVSREAQDGWKDLAEVKSAEIDQLHREQQRMREAADTRDAERVREMAQMRERLDSLDRDYRDALRLNLALQKENGDLKAEIERLKHRILLLEGLEHKRQHPA